MSKLSYKRRDMKTLPAIILSIFLLATPIDCGIDVCSEWFDPGSERDIISGEGIAEEGHGRKEDGAIKRFQEGTSSDFRG